MRVKTEINTLNCDLNLGSELWEQPCDAEDDSQVGPEDFQKVFEHFDQEG